MNTRNDTMSEIEFRAQKLLHYNNLLISQCSSWLPEEEGNRNMEMRILKKQKKQQKAQKIIKQLKHLFL
ncbi:MAG: hypothetical protein FWD56_02735 [Bacteroidales bacterium]|nr:hypothetical protein [Bacteroidales bacterium]